jgi:ATP-dependent Clp protease ATP-binding subunit ClpC
LADPEPVEAASLAAMILRPGGSSKEQVALARFCAELESELASESWIERKDRLETESAEPDFWQRADRQVVLARRALLDRVEEAARTATHLKLRLDRSGTRPAQASRELVMRLALQIDLVQQGIADALEDSPVDVLLMVEPALDGSSDPLSDASWCGRLTDMYRQWARHRHMQLQEFAPQKGKAPTVLQVTGFGAHRTLTAEAGLHILEEIDGKEGQRTVARVRAAAGPLAEPRPSNAYREFAAMLREGGDPSAIVRRYREGPAPLVRDVKTGWRSGRLDAVLGGDFDLIGALQQRAE